MQVRFWGTRGSIAKPGPTTVRYGGNTSCVEVRSSAGTRIVIDCGTGAHSLGQAVLAEAAGTPTQGAILISHTHWDHIQGIPFFAPLFATGHRWDFYAPRGFGDSLRDTLAGQMDFTYFPVTLEAFGAEVGYHDLGEGSFAIDDVRVTTRFLNHPALTLAYRLECDGASLVYACDHEPHSRALAKAEGPIHGQDLDHSSFLAGADLVIHDAQYTPAEYDAKIGWGHSTPHYAAMVCRAAGVRRLAFTHHDPMRTDADIDALVAELRREGESQAPLDIIAAAEGLTIAVEGRAAPAAEAVPSALAAPVPSAVTLPLVLVVANDLDADDPLRQALEDEHVRTAFAFSAAAVPQLAAADGPALLIVDDDRRPAGVDTPEAAERVVAEAAAGAPPPLIVTSSGAKPALRVLPPDGDWIERPFSREFARARIRTALTRSEFRWVRPPLPDNEAERLQALLATGLLDSPREERFDRITRLAAALFRVPVALVSLIDSNRQWFKSCVGIDATETSREISFCAHAVADGGMLVIPDALQDRRFADNPAVTGGMHVRFYAGAPLRLAAGGCAGTLCIVDIRPRAFGDDDQARLRDLADLVELEVNR